MKNFLLILFIGCWNNLASQTIKILDIETRRPIASATLLSNSPKAFAISNAKGEVRIDKFKGAAEIEIRSLGYNPAVISYDKLNQEPFEVFLSPNNLNLDEVVISSSRWRQKTSNIPSKVIQINPKEIALQNPQTAADLLGVSGKVFIQKSQQGGGSPMIRGFATNRLLYTVDGVRMNTAIFRGGNIQNVISLDPFAMESTEVLFGPGSIIYGSDAIGGVMSFQTLTPRYSLTEEPLISGKAISRFSSANNEKTGHLDIQIGSKKWALLSSISYNSFDHLKQGNNGPEDYIKSFYVRRDSIDRIIEQSNDLLQRPTAYDQVNFMQKVRFQAAESLELLYGFHYSETSSYGRYDRHNRQINGLPRYGRWNYGPQKWMMNHFNLLHSKKNNLYDQMNLHLAHQFFEESRVSRDLNDDDERNQIEKLDAISLNIDLNKELAATNTLYYGLEFVYNDVRSDAFLKNIVTNSRSPAGTRYPESNWTSLSSYIKNVKQVSEFLTLQAGIRYSQFIINAQFDTDIYAFPFTDVELNKGALSGSLGLSYRPNEKWLIKANASTGFRAPNIDDIGKVFDSEPGAVTVPNPELDAETAYNIDLGLAKIFKDYLKLDLTAYYTRLENAMVRRNFQFNGMDSILFEGNLSQVQAIQNAAFAEVYGIQAGIELKLPLGFTVSSDINYQKGEEELDDGSRSSSRHAAPLFGTSRINFSYNTFNIQASINYQGEVKHDDLAVSEQAKREIYALDNNGNTYAPSWYAMHVKATISLSEKLTFTTGIENITDQRYRPYNSGVSSPGRNFIFSLQANF